MKITGSEKDRASCDVIGDAIEKSISAQGDK